MISDEGGALVFYPTDGRATSLVRDTNGWQGVLKGCCGLEGAKIHLIADPTDNSLTLSVKKESVEDSQKVYREGIEDQDRPIIPSTGFKLARFPRLIDTITQQSEAVVGCIAKRTNEKIDKILAHHLEVPSPSLKLEHDLNSTTPTVSIMLDHARVCEDLVHALSCMTPRFIADLRASIDLVVEQALSHGATITESCHEERQCLLQQMDSIVPAMSGILRMVPDLIPKHIGPDYPCEDVPAVARSIVLDADLRRIPNVSELQTAIKVTPRTAASDSTLEFRSAYDIPQELCDIIADLYTRPGVLMSEKDWRLLGVQQSSGWVHYDYKACDTGTQLLFRRPQAPQDEVPKDEASKKTARARKKAVTKKTVAKKAAPLRRVMPRSDDDLMGIS